jgi:hypothetical protein
MCAQLQQPCTRPEALSIKLGCEPVQPKHSRSFCIQSYAAAALNHLGTSTLNPKPRNSARLALNGCAGCWRITGSPSPQTRPLSSQCL